MEGCPTFTLMMSFKFYLWLWRKNDAQVTDLKSQNANNNDNNLERQKMYLGIHSIRSQDSWNRYQLITIHSTCSDVLLPAGHCGKCVGEQNVATAHTSCDMLMGRPMRDFVWTRAHVPETGFPMCLLYIWYRSHGALKNSLLFCFWC